MTDDLYLQFTSFKKSDVEKYKGLLSLKNIAAIVLDRKKIALKNTYNNLLEALVVQLDVNLSLNDMDAVSACNSVIVELNDLIESVGLS